MNYALPKNKKDFVEIQELIKSYIVRTPVIESEVLNEMVNAKLYFKCENFQRIGAFKARGALNAVLRLKRHELINGVATHSSGNHAQALAYAAKIAETDATIVMPKNSNKTKIEGVEKLGGKIIFCEPTTEDRENKLKEFIHSSGAVYIPPYNHEWIIGGQGTATKELIEDVPSLERIIAPIGGGGLLSGTALAAKIFGNNPEVYGAEPENLDDARRSFQSGKIEINSPEAITVADGLRTTLGELTFSCIKNNVSDILTVNEDEIVSSMKLMWRHLKITAEPSCAVALAAILKYNDIFNGKLTGVIVSGGNVDLSNIPFL